MTTFSTLHHLDTYILVFRICSSLRALLGNLVSVVVLFYYPNFQRNLALKEVLSDMRELSIFVAGLTGIHTFFNLSYARKGLLNKCLEQVGK